MLPRCVPRLMLIYKIRRCVDRCPLSLSVYRRCLSNCTSKQIQQKKNKKNRKHRLSQKYCE